MSNQFPGTLNTGTSLPNTRATNDIIPASDHNDLVNAQIAVETKLGKGVATPTNVGSVLTVTAAGTTAYVQPTSGTPTFFNVKAYGAVGDGSVNDAPAIQAAINAAFASPRSIGTVYFPAGKYRIDSTLVCSSATSTASGYGVLLLGDGVNATQITKNSSFGPAVTFNGAGGPNNFPTQFGGMQNITINGNVTTGGLLQTSSAQQMTFRNCSFIGSNDVAWDFNTMQDSYFSQCTFNNCGSTTKAVIEIYGSADGTSNMLWFNQIRVETYLKGAVRITRGTGATGGGNNGFFWSQCKFENYPTVAGDHFFADSYTQQLIMNQIFISMGNYNTGYSTPSNGIVFGDGGASPGYNQASFRDVFMNAGPTAGIGNSVIKINGGGTLSGPIMLDNVFGDATPTTAQVVITGAANTQIGLGLIGGPGTLIGGDGSGTRSSLGSSSASSSTPVVKGSVTGTNLTSGFVTGTFTTATTASVTPTANNLALLTVSLRNNGTAPATPTVAGNGLTWVLVNKSDFKTSGSRRSVFLYRAMGSAPTAGTITITFGESETDATWVVDQLAGVVTTGTNGSGAVLQSATSFTASGTSSLSATLGYFNNYRNATYAAFGTDGEDTPVAPTNFAVLGHKASGSNIEAATELSSFPTLTPSITYSNTPLIGCVAIEVVSA